MQLIQVVLPNSYLIKTPCRDSPGQETSSHCAVCRKADNTRYPPPVVLAHFIARRRKECQQNTIIRIFGTYLLNQRASLFKTLPKRQRETRYNASSPAAAEEFRTRPSALHHLPRFTAERSYQVHRNIIEYYCNYKTYFSASTYFRTSMARCMRGKRLSLPNNAVISGTYAVLYTLLPLPAGAFITLPM